MQAFLSVPCHDLQAVQKLKVIVNNNPIKGIFIVETLFKDVLSLFSMNRELYVVDGEFINKNVFQEYSVSRVILNHQNFKAIWWGSFLFFLKGL